VLVAGVDEAAGQVILMPAMRLGAWGSLEFLGADEGDAFGMSRVTLDLRKREPVK